MEDSELVAVCLEEISRGIGGLDSENQGDITLPLDYYLGRLPSLSATQAKDPNASKFVSMDVMDAVEATVAEIMPTFTTDELAVFEPVSEQDENQSEVETALINYLFFNEYGGYTLIQKAVKDVLLHRNCTVKAYWDERVSVEYETLENIPEQAVSMALQPTAPEQVVEVVEQQVSGEEAALPDDQINPLEPQTHTIKIKRITRHGKPNLVSVAPEGVVVCGDHEVPTLEDVRFVAHELIETKSSLIEQGFDPDVVSELEGYNQNIDNYSRSRHTDEYDYTSAHESTKLIRVFECYPLVDFDDDGIAERRKVVISGNRLLENKEWKSVPLIGGVGLIMPHKYKGISLFDRIKEIQDTKTPIIRSIIDGTKLSVNPRVGVITGEVNLDDLLTSRTGGAVRMDQQGSVVPLPNPEIPMSAYSLLQMMDSTRTERGGSAVSTSSQAQKIQGDTAHGIERVMSAMELGNAVIARTIGETIIRGIFLQLHNLIREFHKQPITAKVGGRWITSNPSEWQERTKLSIKIGSSHAERARQASVLTNVVNLQKELGGSILVSEERTYKAIIEGISAGGIDHPERFFVDPGSDEGKKAQQARSQQQQEEKQKQDQTEIAFAESQQQIAEAELMKGHARLQGERYKAENESLKRQLDQVNAQVDAMDKADKTQFAYDKLETENAIKLTELEAQHQRELNKLYEGNRYVDNTGAS